MTTGPFSQTARVSFELSNRCDLASRHKSCPLNKANGPVTLPMAIIEKAVDALRRHGFRGVIDFSNYNEPLIDPRLLDITMFIRRHLPQSRLRILTNGTGLDQQMLDELAEAGVRLVRVSCYSKEESERLQALKKPARMLNYSFMHPKLDDRLGHYERDPLDLPIPCYAPLHELVIACEGFIALCCFDWKRHIKFGDLHKEGLEKIAANGKLRKVHARLSRGDRYLPLCRRCDRLLHSGRHKKIWKNRIRNETA